MARERGSMIDLTSILNSQDLSIEAGFAELNNNIGITNTSRRRKREPDTVVDLTLDSEEEEQVLEVLPKKQKVQQVAEVHSDESDESETKGTQEKRLAPYRKNASKILKDRIQKAQTERLYVIQQKPHQNDPFEREFVVLGSTGNVYTVKICRKPSCTCIDSKDGTSRYHCKHILFILLKVYHLSTSDPRVYQKAFLSTELTDIFDHYGGTNGLMADATVTEKYLELISEGKVRRKKMVPQKLIEGDCPICCEKMKTSDNVIYCKYGCGNNVHKDCYDKWITTKSEASMEEVKCVYCRARWDLDSLKSYYYKDGYLNLREYQERPIDPHILWLLPQLFRLSSNIRNQLSLFQPQDDDDESDDDYF